VAEPGYLWEEPVLVRAQISLLVYVAVVGAITSLCPLTALQELPVLHSFA
jgi:hypothetical protein